MIKNIKSWFTSPSDSGNKTLNISLDVLNNYTMWDIATALQKEIVDQVANLFLIENEALIKKEILNNPKFADAVYNAIVLKKADKI